ncbi:hypothetical protein BKA62DRAFT_776011 [Auriculariales sp. MPI-PUGE-AT-0066]|nr:hypothetical protein BKA62DRAFT_776011 [Auriculariales sp. MPI-PUGE-AT-0066]
MVTFSGATEYTRVYNDLSSALPSQVNKLVTLVNAIDRSRDPPFSQTSVQELKRTADHLANEVDRAHNVCLEWMAALRTHSRDHAYIVQTAYQRVTATSGDRASKRVEYSRKRTALGAATRQYKIQGRKYRTQFIRARTAANQAGTAFNRARRTDENAKTDYKRKFAEHKTIMDVIGDVTNLNTALVDTVDTAHGLKSWETFTRLQLRIQTALRALGRTGWINTTLDSYGSNVVSLDANLAAMRRTKWWGQY